MKKVNALRRLTLVLMTLAAFVFVVGQALAAVKAHHHNSGHSLAAQHLTTRGSISSTTRASTRSRQR
jgi:hypothetical protein